jgi:palmitoyltransferase
MENNKDKLIPLESELSIINKDRTTEVSELISTTNKDSNYSINNNSNNNNSYIELGNEINNNSVNINVNQFNSNPINVSRIKRSTQLRIFIPIVSSKIFISVFFMLKYLVHFIENEEDKNYYKYLVWVLTSLIFLCYFLTIIKSSSQTNVDKYFYLPKNNTLSVNISNSSNELEDLNSTLWINCPFCRAKKFIRSSHCRTCNKCILLRDHHCPFIGSCVGFKNMQYFLNFLFWLDLTMIFYVISFIKFHFFSNKRKFIKIELYVKIIFYVDFAFTFCFAINVMGLMGRFFLNIYNNRTQLENLRTAIVEYYHPISPKCVRDFKRFNIKPEANLYNIGFLSNLYYVIGPTLFHLIFPLPKYNNYILDENCPVFKKIKPAEKLDIFKFMVKKDCQKINLLENDESSPEQYLKICHKLYDGKKIM